MIQKNSKNLESSLILKVEPFHTYNDVTKGWAGLEGADPEFFKKDGCDGGGYTLLTVLTDGNLGGWLVNNGGHLQN